MNLVYHDTRDEAVFAKLSARMQDKLNLFGSLSVVIEDDWIEDIEQLDSKLSEFIERKPRANAFDLRFAEPVLRANKKGLCEHRPRLPIGEDGSEVGSSQDMYKPPFTGILAPVM